MNRLRPLVSSLAPLAALGTAGCVSYPAQVRPQVYYEVPCDMPGAFRADPRPAQLSAPDRAPPDAVVDGSAYSSNVNSPGAQPLCLAQAEVVPPSYARRAYRYYNNYWWPYQGRSHFGFSLGLGHFGGRHSGGGHHGRVHHGRGHH